MILYYLVRLVFKLTQASLYSKIQTLFVFLVRSCLINVPPFCGQLTLLSSSFSLCWLYSISRIYTWLDGCHLLNKIIIVVLLNSLALKFEAIFYFFLIKQQILSCFNPSSSSCRLIQSYKGVMKTSVKLTSTGVDSVDSRPGRRPVENLSLVDVDQ